MRKDFYAYGMGLQVVTEDDLDAIHDATLDVLSTVGIRCTSKRAQEVLADAGCTIDTEKDIIFFPRHVVTDALSHLVYLVAGDGLLCSNQTRLLTLRASQTVFFAKPAAKNTDTAAFLPPRNDGGHGFKSI